MKSNAFYRCGPRHREFGHGCGCHESDYGFQRRFISPDEEKETLEKYKEALKKEIAGVEAKLNQLASK